MNNQIYNILNDMSEVLSISQMKKLQHVLITRLEEQEKQEEVTSNVTFLDMFLTSKTM